MPRERIEYRLAWIDPEDPKARPIRRSVPKRNLTHAVDDMNKHVAERKAGKLAQYWDDFDIEVQARKVTDWYTQEVPE